MRRSVVVLAYPGVQSLDIVGPFDVFAGASQLLAADEPDGGYDLGVEFLHNISQTILTLIRHLYSAQPEIPSCVTTVGARCPISQWNSGCRVPPCARAWSGSNAMGTSLATR